MRTTDIWFCIVLIWVDYRQQSISGLRISRKRNHICSDVDNSDNGIISWSPLISPSIMIYNTIFSYYYKEKEYIIISSRIVNLWLWNFRFSEFGQRLSTFVNASILSYVAREQTYCCGQRRHRQNGCFFRNKQDLIYSHHYLNESIIYCEMS